MKADRDGGERKPITALPNINRYLLPSLSTRPMAPKVASKLTAPMARVCSNEDDVSNPVFAKIVGP